MLQGIATLRAFGRSREQADRIREIGLRYGDSTMTVLRTAFQASLVLEFGAAVAMALVAVELSLRLMGGSIGFASTLAVLIIAPEFFVPLRRFAAAYHEGAAGREAATRILEILDAPPPRARHRARPSAARGAPSSPRARSGTSSCTASPSPTRAARNPRSRDVDLVLPAGRRTAIVGESGAGKSTLARLLLRFVDPDAGRITVGGEALADIDVHAWRGRIAYVPQSPHLFHGTVAENIRLARPDATLDDVAAAARAAGATAFIEDLPDGLETPIGEDGVRLSGGQRQRIAVARAFLRDADLVVLDEPTAHLDPDAEASVAEAIDRLGRGRTVVVISHRSALVEGADVVIELDHGRVVRDPRAPAMILRRVLGLAASRPGWLLLGATVAAVSVIANVALVGTSAYLISRAQTVTNVADLALAITAVRVLAIVRSVSRYLERIVIHAGTFRVLADLRASFFAIDRAAGPGRAPVGARRRPARPHHGRRRDAGGGVRRGRRPPDRGRGRRRLRLRAAGLDRSDRRLDPAGLRGRRGPRPCPGSSGSPRASPRVSGSPRAR